ncbi:hypothetical protein D9M70_624950 [compost metagenome]
MGPGLQAQHLQLALGTQPLIVRHLPKSVHMHQPVHRLPTRAQLMQSANAQAGKRQHAARPQGSMSLGKHSTKV